MKHKNKIFSIAAFLLFLCAACGGKVPWTDTNADTQGLTYDKAKAVIKGMDSVDWVSSEDYDMIKKSFIDDPKSLDETERVALRSMLNRGYANQLIRTANNILNSDCASRHTTLNAVMKEYDARDFGGYVPEGAQAVKDAYALHQKQMQFSISSSYGVALASFRDSYNSAYDSQKRSEAAAIRATNPKCTVIKNRVSESNINKVLAQRKHNYYTALVNKFCNTSDISLSDYNFLTSKLQNNSNNASTLQSRIDNHWEQVQSGRSKESY